MKIHVSLCPHFTKCLHCKICWLMVFASNYGREYFWIPVVWALAAIWRGTQKRSRLKLTPLFVASIAAGEVMKIVMFREGPFEAI